MILMTVPKFLPGTLVRHRRYGYRGVVVEYDPICRADKQWYRGNRTQPNRDQPWYHVLVHGSDTVTYAAEENLQPDESGEPVEDAPEIRIVATEWGFEPATVDLTVGVPVNIVLVNEGAIEHEVEFEGLGLHLHAQPGESVTGSLVPEVSGDFELGCYIPGHYEMGMAGEARVAEANTH